MTKLRFAITQQQKSVLRLGRLIRIYRFFDPMARHTYSTLTESLIQRS